LGLYEKKNKQKQKKNFDKISRSTIELTFWKIASTVRLYISSGNNLHKRAISDGFLIFLFHLRQHKKVPTYLNIKKTKKLKKKLL
jgi:hypothetical protein